jgi:hypothetical protein
MYFFLFSQILPITQKWNILNNKSGNDMQELETKQINTRIAECLKDGNKEEGRQLKTASIGTVAHSSPIV